MKHEPRPAIHMEEYLLTAKVGHKLRHRISGDLQGGANSVSHVGTVSDMAPACQLCGSVGGRVQNRDNGLCLLFCLGESYPPALALMSNTSVPPCVSLVPFNHPTPHAEAQRE